MKKFMCLFAFYAILCPLITNAQDNEINPNARSKSGGRINKVDYYLKDNYVFFDITLKNTGTSNDEEYYLVGFYEIVNKGETSQPTYFVERNTASFYSGMDYSYSSKIDAYYLKKDHIQGTARVTVLLKWKGKVIDKWSRYMNDIN